MAPKTIIIDGEEFELKKVIKTEPVKPLDDYAVWSTVIRGDEIKQTSTGQAYKLIWIRNDPNDPVTIMLLASDGYAYPISLFKNLGVVLFNRVVKADPERWSYVSKIGDYSSTTETKTGDAKPLVAEVAKPSDFVVREGDVVCDKTGQSAMVKKNEQGTFYMKKNSGYMFYPALNLLGQPVLPTGSWSLVYSAADCRALSSVEGR